MPRERLKFYSDCVGWPPDDVHRPGGLVDMIQHPTERQVTRRTFLAHVDREDMRHAETMLGYAPHDPGSCLRMSQDWHVSYHRSKLHGRTVYYFKHSAIEYVFTKGGDA